MLSVNPIGYNFGVQVVLKDVEVHKQDMHTFNNNKALDSKRTLITCQALIVKKQAHSNAFSSTHLERKKSRSSCCPAESPNISQQHSSARWMIIHFTAIRVQLQVRVGGPSPVYLKRSLDESSPMLPKAVLHMVNSVSLQRDYHYSLRQPASGQYNKS